MKPNMLVKELCTNCTLCLSQCSFGVLKKNAEGKIELFKDEYCIECSHCIAICPEGALRVFNVLPDDITPPVSDDTLFGILKSRRSMRKYKEKEVSDQMLTRLNEYARFSPTGSNAEGTKIIFVKSKEKREKLTKALMGFWFKLEKIATFPPIKWIAGFFTSRKRLNMRLGMLKNFTSKFKQGHDSLFYNAPVIAFLYTEKDSASTPKDDCCYALFSMALGAQTMGLSSCINQLAVISFEKSKKKIRKILGLSKNQTIRACATFGYPAFEYKRTVFRKQLVPEIK